MGMRLPAIVWNDRIFTVVPRGLLDSAKFEDVVAWLERQLGEFPANVVAQWDPPNPDLSWELWRVEESDSVLFFAKVAERITDLSAEGWTLEHFRDGFCPDIEFNDAEDRERFIAEDKWAPARSDTDSEDLEALRDWEEEGRIMAIETMQLMIKETLSHK